MLDDYVISKARYAKGKIALRFLQKSAFKSELMCLVEGVGGRWSNRERAYIVSVAMERKVQLLHTAGFGYSPISGKFHDPKYNWVSKKDALRLAKEWHGK